MQIDYDPDQITYEEILQLFWDNHNPTGRFWSRQYMSIIFYHNDTQKEAAEASKANIEQISGVKVNTEIIAFSNFYLAEDYHQKYYLQNNRALANELKAYYPVFSDFINSAVAARINGIVAGYGDPSLFAEEGDDYGLSSDSLDILQQALETGGKINNPTSFF
jgi:peptide-methionine (S)-S-oxide reductase